MKKILLVFVLLLIQNTVLASQLPRYINSVKNWGIGAVVAPREFILYKEPDKNSKKIMNVEWNNSGDLKCNGKECKDDIFVAFVPENGYAVLSVVDEDTNWANVFYSDSLNKTAWIKLDNDTKFYTWGKFLLTFGKKHGLFIMNDVRKDDRKLYAQPQEGSQSVDSFELAKHITPWFVSGNWVMVKLLHYDNKQKTGWLKWRDSDGRIWAFVNLKSHI